MEKSIPSAKNIYYPPGGILMWILIFLELFTFGIALIALAYYSKQTPEEFHQSRLLLNPFFGTINTVFLLTSGYFMAKTVTFYKKNERKKTNQFLKLTIIGGLLFLILKSIEYWMKIEHGYTVSYDTFFSFYWMLTLFHVIHVLVGIVILISIYFGINRNESDTKLEDVEASAAFWHMCDLIWLILFPMLYLIL